ncbi:MAG: hypothetical protein U1D55_09585 [Phycisphaerae bacterium]
MSDALRITSARKWHAAKKILDSLQKRGLVERVSGRMRDPNSYYRLVEKRRENGNA